MRALKTTYTEEQKSCLLERHLWTRKGMSGLISKTTNASPFKRTKCLNVYAFTPK